ncbi:MAG: alpha/beta hydrolase [Chitinophagaceae bacterium]
MQSAFVNFNSSRIHYSYAGKGSRMLLCFHGYGETEESFHFLQPYLEHDYQIIAIDLPYHGKTKWKEGLKCSVTDLTAIINTIRIERSITSSSFTVMGFSLGGRLALSLLQETPDSIEKAVLLAPDGFTVNFWYWLATQTRVGNRLFKFTMRHVSWFKLLLKTGNTLKMVNPSVYKFTKHFIDDKQVRNDLYVRWTCMRKFRPELRIVKTMIVRYHMPVTLVYGEYDKIIRYEHGERFRSGIEPFCTVQVIASGHQVLHQKNAEVIVNALAIH